MAQDYYTLEEAASIVHMAPDDLKALARKNELRSFQDRGTWRFRVQDIQELARRRGQGSDQDLVLGESPAPKPADSPAPRTPGKSREAEVFDFTFDADDESIGVGKEFLLDVPGSSRKLGGAKKAEKDGPKSGPKTPGSKSPGPKSPGPRSPAPKPGSDSDVRLVAQGSDVDFKLAVDSDAKLVDDSKPPQAKQPPRGRSGLAGPASPRPGPASPRPGPASPRPGMNPPGPPVDSGVRLVPMDSDSDVRIVGPGSDEAELPLGASPPRSTSDSDIRLEQQQHRPPSEEGMLTEEINLDEELRKQEAKKANPLSKIRPKPPSAPALPSTSPFELSEGELNLPPLETGPTPQAKASPKDSSSDFELTPHSPGSSADLKVDSSDFDLTPAGTSSSPVEPPSSDDEFRLDLPDDEVSLGGPASGISLTNPADSGISLEQGGDGSDEIEFELSLDADTTPKPQGQVAAARSPADSDSEFELTLDAEAPSPSSSDSEFELTLDSEESKSGADSDSEFELTLDDSGGLSPLESGQAKSASGEQDIFETDFDVPALEEESGSEAVALDADTNLDSSDFDLALDEQDAAAEEESGSQVVALDDEELADDAEATVQRSARKGKPKTKGKKKPAIAVEDEEEAEGQPFGALDDEGEVQAEEEVEEEDEAPARTVVKEKLIPAAPWGAMPVVLMLPCVAVMVVVALLGFELVQSMNGYHPPGLITRTLTGLVDGKK